jgi:hypothetical protein
MDLDCCIDNHLADLVLIHDLTVSQPSEKLCVFAPWRLCVFSGKGSMVF